MLQLAAFAAFLVLATDASRGDITWNITYGDQGTTTGFYDPVEGATRRATLTAVTQYINTIIDANGTIDLRINASETDGTGFLASAGSLYFTGPNGIHDGLVFEHATSGSDPAAGYPDGDATFDFGFNWNSGLDLPSANQYDLFSVALHEFTHALGFTSLINEIGLSGISRSDPGVFSTFDSFLTDTFGNPLIDAAGNFVASTSVLTSGNVFFKTATGALIEMYAPQEFAEGSSLSHVDLDASVMSYAIANGETQRTYSADELAILSTLGYNVQVAAVPEPASLVLLSATAAGFGLCRLRRRRTVEPTISA